MVVIERAKPATRVVGVRRGSVGEAASYAGRDLRPCGQCARWCRRSPSEIGRVRPRGRRPASSARTAARRASSRVAMRRASSGVAAGSSTTKSASLPGAKLPMRSSRSQRARAAERREVERAQRRQRAGRASCATLYASSSVRSIEKLVPPPTSVPSPTRTPCRRAAAEVEQPAAEEQVRRRAERHRRAGGAHARAVGVVEMDAMRVDRVARAPGRSGRRRRDSCGSREELGRPRDFARGSPRRASAGTRRDARRAGARELELALGRRRREARRDRVEQPAAAVPALDQRLAMSA